MLVYRNKNYIINILLEDNMTGLTVMSVDRTLIYLYENIQY